MVHMILLMMNSDCQLFKERFELQDRPQIAHKDSEPFFFHFWAKILYTAQVPQQKIKNKFLGMVRNEMSLQADDFGELLHEDRSMDKSNERRKKKRNVWIEVSTVCSEVQI